ncbi:MAG: hypothetical protein WB949_17590 [Candidatus Acidiferrales bacterium]
MRIIGCDLHARQQTLAVLDTTTGPVMEKTLTHSGPSLKSAAMTAVAGLGLLIPAAMGLNDNGPF